MEPEFIEELLQKKHQLPEVPPPAAKARNPLSVALEALKKTANVMPNPALFGNMTMSHSSSQEGDQPVQVSELKETDIVKIPIVQVQQVTEEQKEKEKQNSGKRKQIKKRKNKVKKEAKDVNMYTLRHEIVEGNEVHCLAFPTPLLDFGDHNYSDDSEYSEDLKQLPSIISAKKKWKKIYQVVMDKKTQIPLKQMAWKAKHQDLLFEQIYENFTYGRPIGHQRKRLANLHENMRFKGGPRDKEYKKKVLGESKKGLSSLMSTLKAQLRKQPNWVIPNNLIKKTPQRIKDEDSKKGTVDNMVAKRRGGIHLGGAEGHQAQKQLQQQVTELMSKQRSKSPTLRTAKTNSIHCSKNFKMKKNRVGGVSAKRKILIETYNEQLMGQQSASSMSGSHSFSKSSNNTSSLKTSLNSSDSDDMVSVDLSEQDSTGEEEEDVDSEDSFKTDKSLEKEEQARKKRKKFCAGNIQAQKFQVIDQQPVAIKKNIKRQKTKIVGNALMNSMNILRQQIYKSKAKQQPRSMTIQALSPNASSIQEVSQSEEFKESQQQTAYDGFSSPDSIRVSTPAFKRKKTKNLAQGKGRKSIAFLQKYQNNSAKRSSGSVSQLSDVTSEAGFTKDEQRDEVRELFIQPIVEHIDEEIPSPGLKTRITFGKQNAVIGLVPQMIQGYVRSSGNINQNPANDPGDHDNSIANKLVSKRLSNIKERISEENIKNLGPIKKTATQYYNSTQNFAGLQRGRTIGKHGIIEVDRVPLKKYSQISQLKVKSGDESIKTSDMNKSGSAVPEEKDDQVRRASTIQAAGLGGLSSIKRTTHKTNKLAMLTKISSSTLNEQVPSLIEDDESESISSKRDDSEKSFQSERFELKRRPKIRPSTKFSAKSMLEAKALNLNQKSKQESIEIESGSVVEIAKSVLSSVQNSSSKSSVSISERSSNQEQSVKKASSSRYEHLSKRSFSFREQNQPNLLLLEAYHKQQAAQTGANKTSVSNNSNSESKDNKGVIKVGVISDNEKLLELLDESPAQTQKFQSLSCSSSNSQKKNNSDLLRLGLPQKKRLTAKSQYSVLSTNSRKSRNKRRKQLSKLSIQHHRSKRRNSKVSNSQSVAAVGLLGGSSRSLSIRRQSCPGVGSATATIRERRESKMISTHIVLDKIEQMEHDKSKSLRQYCAVEYQPKQLQITENFQHKSLIQTKLSATILERITSQDSQKHKIRQPQKASDKRIQSRKEQISKNYHQTNISPGEISTKTKQQSLFGPEHRQVNSPFIRQQSFVPPQLKTSFTFRLKKTTKTPVEEGFADKAAESRTVEKKTDNKLSRTIQSTVTEQDDQNNMHFKKYRSYDQQLQNTIANQKVVTDQKQKMDSNKTTNKLGDDNDKNSQKPQDIQTPQSTIQQEQAINNVEFKDELKFQKMNNKKKKHSNFSVLSQLKLARQGMPVLIDRTIETPKTLEPLSLVKSRQPQIEVINTEYKHQNVSDQNIPQLYNSSQIKYLRTQPLRTCNSPEYNNFLNKSQTTGNSSVRQHETILFSPTNYKKGRRRNNKQMASVDWAVLKQKLERVQQTPQSVTDVQPKTNLLFDQHLMTMQPLNPSIMFTQRTTNEPSRNSNHNNNKDCANIYKSFDFSSLSRNVVSILESSKDTGEKLKEVEQNRRRRDIITRFNIKLT